LSEIVKKSPRKSILYAGYALLAVIVAFEVTVMWLMIHPQVSEDYRAYYIDHTTTCLNQLVSGEYVLGTTVSFLPEGREQAKKLRVCGWDGPSGEGTHAVGESSRLRFVFDGAPKALTLSLTMFAIDTPPLTDQPVDVVINGEAVGQLTVKPGDPQVFELALPAELVAKADGKLEVYLNYPKARTPEPGASNTRKRSIKVTSVRVFDPAG
jgi:hypothetical protein